MKKINRFSISLMEKSNEPTEEKGKANYIIKTSGSLDLKQFEEEHHIEDDYEEFVFAAGNAIYEELIVLSKDKKAKYDTVGIWITLESDRELDNAIDISTLNDIQKYGNDDVNAFVEFFKMTLNNESEESK